MLWGPIYNVRVSLILNLGRFFLRWIGGPSRNPSRAGEVEDAIPFFTEAP